MSQFGISPPRDPVPIETLNQLNDCTLVCDSGAIIPANTFIMVQACSTLSNMFEDLEEGTSQGRVFHIHGVEKHTLQVLVDLLHHKMSVSGIQSIDEIRHVIHAMDYLGCRYKFKKLVQRLWQLLRLMPNTVETFGNLCENAPLVMPEYSTAFLTKAKSIAPEWHRFRDLIEQMDMTPQLAVLCMNTLMNTFPPVCIIFGIIDASPPSHVQQIVTAVLSIHNIGLHFHPEEFMLILEHCVTPGHGSHEKKGDPYMNLAKACLDSFKGVNTPMCISKLSGTFIYFQHKTRCSFFVTIKKPVNRKARVQFQHKTATFEIDAANHTLESTIHLHKFQEHAESVNEVYVRYVPFYSRELGCSKIECGNDIWYTVTDIDHMNRGRVRHVINIPQDTFPLLKYVRYDIFWLHDPRVF
jgi:hypothetical protein